MVHVKMVSDLDVDMVAETVRQLARAIRVRKPEAVA
jgi:hypothetical protein